MDTLKCLNCNTEIQEDNNFCSNCGQHTKESLTVSTLFKNTISNYFSVDSRFFRSFFPLLFKPGYLASKFSQGKQNSYLHPAQFYLFFSTFFFLLFSFSSKNLDTTINEPQLNNLIQYDSIHDEYNLEVSDSILNSSISKEEEEVIDRINKELDVDINKKDEIITKNFLDFLRSVNTLGKEGFSSEEIANKWSEKRDLNTIEKLSILQFIKIYRNKGGYVFDVFFRTLPAAIFFLLPVFSLLLKLFYRRTGFAYHMIWSFYYFTLLFVIWIILILLNYIFSSINLITFLLLLYCFIYYIRGLKIYYKQSSFKTFVKGLSILFIYSIIILPLTFIILLVTTFYMY